MAATPRFRSKQPADVWSTKERLCLAASVLRSGDQNWVSVSRSIKPFGEASRPPDWFSQKNCALQYAELLDKVETPKRKRGERSDSIDTPGDTIVRKLTHDRIEELKKVINEEQQRHKKLKRELEMVRTGQLDEKLEDLLRGVQDELRAKEIADNEHQKWLQEREQKLAAIKAASGKVIYQPPPKNKRNASHNLTRAEELRRYQSELSEQDSNVDSPLSEPLSVEVDDIASPLPPQAPNMTTTNLAPLESVLAPGTSPRPSGLSVIPSSSSTSPLLTSLLKSPSPANAPATVTTLQTTVCSSPKTNILGGALQGVFQASPIKMEIVSSSVLSSPTTTTAAGTVSRTISGPPLPFFNPKSALATAAARQMAVATAASSSSIGTTTTTPSGYFTSANIINVCGPGGTAPTQSIHFHPTHVLHSTTITTPTTSSAPTLSKLLEMPPSLPGKLPPLPIVNTQPISVEQTISAMIATASSNLNRPATPLQAPAGTTAVAPQTQQALQPAIVSLPTPLIIPQALPPPQLLLPATVVATVPYVNVTEYSNVSTTNTVSTPPPPPPQSPAAVVVAAAPLAAVAPAVPAPVPVPTPVSAPAPTPAVVMQQQQETQSFVSNAENWIIAMQTAASNENSQSESGLRVSDSDLSQMGVTVEEDGVDDAFRDELDPVSASLDIDMEAIVNEIMKEEIVVISPQEEEEEESLIEQNDQLIQSVDILDNEDCSVIEIEEIQQEQQEHHSSQQQHQAEVFIEGQQEQIIEPESVAIETVLEEEIVVVPTSDASEVIIHTIVDEEVVQVEEEQVQQEECANLVEQEVVSEVVVVAPLLPDVVHKNQEEPEIVVIEEPDISLQQIVETQEEQIMVELTTQEEEVVETKQTTVVEVEKDIPTISVNTIETVELEAVQLEVESLPIKEEIQQEEQLQQQIIAPLDDDVVEVVEILEEEIETKIQVEENVVEVTQYVEATPIKDEIPVVVGELELPQVGEEEEKKEETTITQEHQQQLLDDVDTISVASQDEIEKGSAKSEDSPLPPPRKTKRSRGSKVPLSTESSDATNSLEPPTKADFSEESSEVPALRNNSSSRETSEARDEELKSELHQESAISETSSVGKDSVPPQSEEDSGMDVVKPKAPSSISDSIPNSPVSTPQSDDQENLREYKVWKKAIMLVWRAAANHKYANVFLHPVTNDVAPGYHSIVFRPMDLSLIKKNIENGIIKTTIEFQRDVMLMFQNAIMYNSSDHDVFQMAVEMQKEVMEVIQDFLATQLMVQATDIKVLRGREKKTDFEFRDDEGGKRKRTSTSESSDSKTKKRRSKLEEN